MNKRERVISALQHRQPDETPYHIEFTLPVKEKLERHYQTADLNKAIGNYFLRLRTAFAWQELKPGFWQDGFGVVWDRSIDKDIGNPVDFILADKNKLDKYSFPEIKPELFQDIPKINAENKEGLFTLYSIGFSLFERAWALRGMENLFLDMVADPPFVEALLDRITDFNLRLVDEAFKFPVQMVFFGDDYGQQRGLLMGPKYWRKYIKPRLAKVYGKVKAKGLFVGIHTCGDIEEILPDLIEIGVDLYNPFQPEVTDIYRIKKEYGGRLSFFGGLSTQRVLPFGTPEDVGKEVKRLIREIGAGGGYILAPAHATPKDVPLENVLAMIETVQNQ